MKSRVHRIGIVSLGCAKNLVDSEVLMRQLEANHFELIFDPVDALRIDTAIINTCGFINDAKQESVDAILQYALAKKDGLIGKLFVMGCLSERYRESLKREIPEVDAFFGVNELGRIVRHLGGRVFSELVGERALSTPAHYAYLKIAEGCSRKCSFCAIPMIRGKHISRPLGDLINEAQYLVDKGVKEINLISQDTTYYGLDLTGKRELPALLSSLSRVKGLQWIRLHYTHPDQFPVEIIDIINSSVNICKYIDLPLQHSSDRILRSMNRGSNFRKSCDLINTIRKRAPGIAIRTTFITGYPGETEQEFSHLKEFIRGMQFDRVGVFPYSHEEDTPAFLLKDSVSERKKKARAEELMMIQQEISTTLNQKKTGKFLNVMIDREENGYYVGRTEADSPDIDNEVLIPANKKPLVPGSIYEVLITGAESFDLFGEVK